MRNVIRMAATNESDIVLESERNRLTIDRRETRRYHLNLSPLE